MKFNIGDRVSSKFSGYPMVGTILSYIYGLEYISHMNKPVESYYTWNKIDDQWPTKTVYTVKFDTPFRTMTPTEFWAANHIPDYIRELAVDDAAKNIIYRAYSPPQTMAMYIEEDLELIEQLDAITNNGELNG